MSSAASCDVVVIGGGPAGAALALRLAGYGFRACLLDAGSGVRHHVGESLPPGAASLLDELGVFEWLGRAARPRPARHLVAWGGKRVHVIEQEGGALVFRGDFDRGLREAARQGGAIVLEGARVLGVTSERERALVRFRQDGVERGLSTRFVADASGRTGVLGRRLRVREAGFRTLAVTGHWHVEGPRSSTLVESFIRGWIWAAALESELVDVTVMLDGEHAGGGVERQYLSAIAAAPRTAALLGNARAAGPPRVVDATPYTARRSAGRDFLLLGDAASSLDPISAHGVHKALDSARTAAVAIHTILERPQSADDAVRFHEQRERRLYETVFARWTSLYRDEDRWPEETFWRRRRTLAPELPPGPPRLRPPLEFSMRFRAGECARLVEAPVLEGDFITRREVLVGPGCPEGARYLGPVCLPDLFRDLLAGRTAAEAGCDEASRRALEWLYRTGLVEARGARAMLVRDGRSPIP